MARMLESEEAARRLGVKLGTLYAYVSRGLLTSHPAPGGRRSLFDLDDVERMARRARGGRLVETRLTTITTSITQIREDGPAYRGVPAVGLAAREPYESVAELLWATDVPRVSPWIPAALDPVPDLRTHDRLRWAVVMAGARDALRADLRGEAVVRSARSLVATMVGALDGPPDDGPGPVGSVAERLADRLAPGAPEPVAAAVNAALVVLADHELATSTLAVRVAASTRADLYDAVLAGLGTLAGPLHGGASRLALGLLEDAEREGPERAFNEVLRWQGMLPGFGHTVYRDGDPRVSILLDHADRLADGPRRGVVHAVIDLAAAHDIPAPNVDLGLAAIVYATGMPPDAGQTLFSIARVAGWTAHYLEELGERPIRFRARAVYAAGG